MLEPILINIYFLRVSCKLFLSAGYTCVPFICEENRLYFPWCEFFLHPFSFTELIFEKFLHC